MIEKRNYIRFFIEGSVKFKTDDASNVVMVDLADVSFVGCALYLKEKKEIGTVIRFELNTELMDYPLIGKGKINHVKEIKKAGETAFKTGVEFVDVDKDLLLVLLNKIQKKICLESKKSWQLRHPHSQFD